MNIDYYEMNKKNVHMIDTNSDVGFYKLVDKLREFNLIGRIPVRGKMDVFWVKCSRNDSRIYASKEIQLEVSGNKIFIGSNSDYNVWNLGIEIMVMLHKEFPFSNLRQVRSYISGDIDWTNDRVAAREKILYANYIRKNSKYYNVKS